MSLIALLETNDKAVACCGLCADGFAWRCRAPGRCSPAVRNLPGRRAQRAASSIEFSRRRDAETGGRLTSRTPAGKSSSEQGRGYARRTRTSSDRVRKSPPTLTQTGNVPWLSLSSGHSSF